MPTGQRRRVSQRSSEPCSENVKALYEDLFINARLLQVDPSACVPWIKIRPISNSGVHRLMQIFKGGDEVDNKAQLSGIAVGTDCATVIILSDDQMHLVHAYLKEEGLSEKEIQEKVNEHPVWYGIIDGCHSHCALKRLKSSDMKWASFRWTVMVLSGNHPIERYRQYARAMNARHDKSFYVELTLYDELNNLRQEYESMCIQSTPTQADVARAYFGSPSVTKTMTIKSSLAIRLSRELIEELGKISNLEDPNMCLKSKYIDTGTNKTTTEVLSQMDCRVFRNFVNVTSLRQANKFFNATTKREVEAQIHTLHRAREEFESHFKPVQHAFISEHYKRSLKALNEQDKFFKFTGLKSWPTSMKIVRHNLLRSFVMDEQVDSNDGNDLSVIVKIQSAVKRSNMKLYDKMMSNIKKAQEEVSTINNNNVAQPQITDNGKNSQPEKPSPSKDKDLSNSEGKNNTSPTSSTREDNPEENSSAEDRSSSTSGKKKCSNDANVNNSDKGAPVLTPDATNDEDKQPEEFDGVGESDCGSKVESLTEEEKEKRFLAEDLEKLKDKGLQCYNMSWEEFSSSEWSISSPKVDLILTEPPTAPSRNYSRNRPSRSSGEEIDKEEVEKFPAFCKRTLVKGGYVVLITPFYLHQEWCKSFSSAAFDVMDYPYIMSKDSSTVPSRASKYPQCGNLFAMVATMPGEHPKKFRPKFSGPFSHINCQNDRKLSTMYNVPSPRTKLLKPGTRIPFNSSELSVKMLSSFLDLFSPLDGSVLDPFAGTMTTSMAAAGTGRCCISIERNTQCFTAAVQRLRGLLPRSNVCKLQDLIESEEDMELCDPSSNEQPVKTNNLSDNALIDEDVIMEISDNARDNGYKQSSENTGRDSDQQDNMIGNSGTDSIEPIVSHALGPEIAPVSSLVPTRKSVRAPAPLSALMKEKSGITKSMKRAGDVGSRTRNSSKMTTAERLLKKQLD